MALHIPTFFTRLGSAVVFSAIMLSGFITGYVSLFILLLFIQFLALKEYVNIVEKIIDIQYSKQLIFNFLGIGTALFLFVSTLPLSACSHQVAIVLSSFNTYFGGVLIGFLLIFFLIQKHAHKMPLLYGVGYISVSMALVVQLRNISALLPIIILLLIWMNDTLAYLCGSFFGKRPFFPSISPKKTIEGTMGGVLFTMLFATIWGYFTCWFPLWQWIVLGAIASIAGTAGDLAESKLKRMAKIKDSGNIMPGHGGVLDRFDSLLFVSNVAFLFCLFFVKCTPYTFWGIQW